MTGCRALVVLGLLGAMLGLVAPAAGSDSAAPPATDARCGNGRREPPETCDDGNTQDGDDCPSNCRIERCTPSDVQLEVSVTMAHPRDVTVGGVVVLLDYPEGRVSIPGAIGERTVAARISHVPQHFASSPYDLDYAVRQAVLLNRQLPPGEIFRVRFDRCRDTAAPGGTDFTCRVEQASTPSGRTLPTDGITCTAKTL